MSLKDLFGKTSEKIVTSQQLETLYKEAESKEYLEEVVVDNNRFLPSVDFSSASNFARYGSAEKYYSDAIKNIYQRYPYDGSKKEKLEWKNNSSQFDNYVFDNIYPKTTGYINLSGSYNYEEESGLTQHILFYGGPNTSSVGSSIIENFQSSNIYNTGSNRGFNLELDANKGITVEFWLKLDDIETIHRRTILDIWNKKESSNSRRFKISYQNNNIIVDIEANVNLSHTFAIDNENKWKFYSIIVKNIDDSSKVDLYVNGSLHSTVYNNYNIDYDQQKYGVIGCIGAYLGNTPDGIYYDQVGAYQLNGSIDEFRFWKTARTSQQIARNWFTSIGGGTNTDDANTDLGVYYKFNEGITGDSNIDSRVLDYSGRISNGTIVNYNSSVRSTGSAINEYSEEYSEKPDPIIYSQHPLVQQTLENCTLSGSLWDTENNSNIYKSIPAWIVEEQEKVGSEDLSHLVQIISSYFDTLHLQIEGLPSLKQTKYYSDSDKPTPFINRILSSYDFQNIDIFNNSTFIEDVLSRNEEREFEKSLTDIKNTIYQNIYNNLAYIYKSKGTEKSIRNLIRCFGVDDELIKINLYADNTTYKLDNSYRYTSEPKKFVDFNHKDRYEATVIQMNGVNQNDDRFRFIPLTFQCEAIFPKKPEVNDPNYSNADFETVSIFGVNNNSSLFTFAVTAERDSSDSKDVYFKLSGSFNGIPVELTSSVVFGDTYDNQRWNFNVRIKHSKLENIDISVESTIGDYIIEFDGINSSLDSIENIFSASAIVPQYDMQQAIKTEKKVYVGSRYNGSSIQYFSDVKVSSVRFWLDYLSNKEIQEHAKDASNYGRQYPYWNSFINFSDGSTLDLSRSDLLVLNWDFNEVTTSNSFGEFIVRDTSNEEFTKGGWLGPIIGQNHQGIGKYFPFNSSQIVNREFIYSAKQQHPETISTNDLIEIRDVDDIITTKDSRPVKYFFSIEKSMSAVINDEILKWFATIDAFNNLIGEPIEKYRVSYKNLERMRQLFFEKVGNTPDFEKFLEFYKWIDSSISLMVQQLIPASANVSDKVRNIVESHILERNKYQNKLPIVELKKDQVPSVRSHLDFKYEDQKAPASPAGELWLRDRVNRTDPLVATNVPEIDENREIIRKVKIAKNLNTLPNLYDKDNEAVYEGRRDNTRTFSNVVRIVSNKEINPLDVINPVSIKNTEISNEFVFASASLTGSGQLFSKQRGVGNYKNRYEYFQTSGRTNNNLELPDIIDELDITATNHPIFKVDRKLPERSVVKTVFVERFSAPGGPEVNSRGAMNPESEEFSVYNGLNNRNLIVRDQYNKWLSETSSVDPENPSYHSVPKNPAYYLDEDENTVVKYDNGFISHQIPQSDAQYAWITASLVSRPKVSGYFNEFANLNSYNTSSAAFISASNADFLGLNLTSSVIKVIDTSTKTIDVLTSSLDLNAYLHNLNGPYQGASWKFLRGAENKIVVDSRKNNNILVDDSVYREPPVEFNKPMNHIIRMSGSEDILLSNTYDNNRNTFANSDLVLSTNAVTRKEQQAHDKLIELQNIGFDPKPDILSISHAEIIFPKKENIGLKESRTRPLYDDSGFTGSVVDMRTFWKDNYLDRRRIDGSYNIFGNVTSSYSVLNDFTSSIMGTFPVLHKVKNRLTASIFSMDSLTGSSEEYTGSITGDIYAGTKPSANTKFTISYGGLMKGALASYSIPEHKYFITTASGEYSLIQTNTIKDTFQAFKYSNLRLSPRLQYVFNNFITPNYDYYNSGSLSVNGLLYPDVVYNDGTNSGYFGSYNSLIKSCNLIYFINNGYEYDLDKTSNNTPFFNSYEEFNSGLKEQSLQYSLVPEFTINNFMNHYINNGFNSQLSSSYLNLDGGLNYEYKDINNSFINTNTIFKYNLDEIKIKQENIKLNLKVSALKKLLPYRGFYPSEKVVELGSEFVNSFIDLNKNFIAQSTSSAIAGKKYDCAASNGTPIDQQILTITQPLFAPGVLLNTIKSSIAVDFPVIITSSISASYSLGSSSLPAFYGHIKGYNTADNLPTNYTGAVHISSSLNYRFPFESLIEFDTILPSSLQTTSSNLFYLNPTYYSTDVISGSDRNSLALPSYNLSTKNNIKSFTFDKPNYKLGMHNFLAEIPNFFLENNLSNFTSKEDWMFDVATSGTTYSMDVVLERDKEYREFVFNKYFDNIRNIDSIYTGSYLTLPGTDSIYGPPVRFFDNLDLNNSKFNVSYYSGISKIYDSPAYAPYVPPYYYGKSIARLKFTADDTRKYTLDEIFNKLQIEYINEDAEALFKARTGFLGSTTTTTFITTTPLFSPLPYEVFLYDSYYTTPNETYPTFLDYWGVNYQENYKNSPAYQQMMTLSSSINLMLKTENKRVTYNALNNTPLEINDRDASTTYSWVIQTKFETPSINFANIDIPNKPKNIAQFVRYEFPFAPDIDALVDVSYKGLWTTYSDKPVSDSSPRIKMYLQENTVGDSLIEMCGFQKDEKRTIGKIASKKEISEGIIVIPYTQQKNRYNKWTKSELRSKAQTLRNKFSNEPGYFFDVQKNTIEKLLNIQFSNKITTDQILSTLNSNLGDKLNNSIVKTMKGMANYVLPPHLDWLRNRDINPFVMYFFEFKSELTQKDLSDIWQGVMPELSKKVEEEEETISHNFTEDEFFHGKKLPEDIKFKIFKVKKRANINYYKLTADSKDDERFKFKIKGQDVIPEFSYNWPYDNFSLVELINVEAGLEVNKTVETEKYTPSLYE